MSCAWSYTEIILQESCDHKAIVTARNVERARVCEEFSFRARKKADRGQRKRLRGWTLKESILGIKEKKG